MGKRETPAEVVRRVGRDAFGFLAEAGFTGPCDIDGGLDYDGHGLLITVYHHYWIHESAVVAFVEVLDDPDPGPGPCAHAAVEQLYAECGLGGAINHLPHTAYGPRLAAVRVRAFAAAVRALMPFLLAPDRAALVRRASTRP
ncbi:hypothetical protein ACIHCQ_38230 [Streptomyces sp. NPDC052236]|uniref:hypothetical protein n=1 Tax=Streptomyces sp. NPDC052236 TaxID=3365686 RepID=UPI0037D5B9B8